MTRLQEQGGQADKREKSVDIKSYLQQKNNIVFLLRWETMGDSSKIVIRLLAHFPTPYSQEDVARMSEICY
ncbi:hypothetical protein [Dapis sp. BLCC M229]|uniref:hypothetical protein n=1 Tax=Dapis sp. BLCC M229 TaxID=3400188 RepID=UPI003CF52846